MSDGGRGLRLSDLENDLDVAVSRALNGSRLRRSSDSFGADDLGTTEAGSAGEGYDDMNQTYLMQTFMKRKKVQEERVREELEMDDMVDSELTNQVLLAELRGIQYEIAEYKRLREERERMAKSLPLGPRNGGAKSHKTYNIAGPALAKSVLSPRFSKRDNVSPRHDAYKNNRQAPASTRYDIRQEVQEVFEAENKNLENIVRSHYDKVGAESVYEIGQDFSRQRKEELAALRSTLEAENEAKLEKVRNTLKEELQTEKDLLTLTYQNKRDALESDLRDEFSTEANKKALEAYRQELEQKHTADLSALKRQLKDEHVRRMNELAEEKLVEKENELQNVRQRILEDHRHKEQRMLRDLENALSEGATQARAGIITSVKAEAEEEVRKVKEFWKGKRNSFMKKIKDEITQEKNERIEAFEGEERSKLESAKQKLQMEMESELSRMLTERSATARERKSAELSKLREELERKSRQDFEALEHTFESDLRASRATVENEVLAKVHKTLEDERIGMKKAFTKEMTEIEQEFSQLVVDARDAFRSFRRELEEERKKNSGDSYGSDDSEEDGSLDGDKRFEWKPPKTIPPNQQGEKVVSGFLQAICDSYNELAERLRHYQSKLAETRKELILVRKESQLRSGSTKKELAETKKVVQKLFAANHYLKSLPKQPDI